MCPEKPGSGFGLGKMIVQNINSWTKLATRERYTTAYRKGSSKLTSSVPMNGERERVAWIMTRMDNGNLNSAHVLYSNDTMPFSSVCVRCFFSFNVGCLKYLGQHVQKDLVGCVARPTDAS